MGCHCSFALINPETNKKHPSPPKKEVLGGGDERGGAVDAAYVGAPPLCALCQRRASLAVYFFLNLTFCGVICSSRVDAYLFPCLPRRSAHTASNSPEDLKPTRRPSKGTYFHVPSSSAHGRQSAGRLLSRPPVLFIGLGLTLGATLHHCLVICVSSRWTFCVRAYNGALCKMADLISTPPPCRLAPLSTFPAAQAVASPRESTVFLSRL